jgi:glycerol-3-phosphate acyltransferase PlsX
MGGDGAPEILVEGALAALDEWPGRFEVVLVGQPEVLGPVLPAGMPSGLRIAPASQVIEQTEPPVKAIRTKRDSSIVIGVEMLRDGGVDAFISAGSTGAVMAASLLLLGPLPGVDRPTVGTVFPTSADPTLVLDAGANVNTRPAHLHQFAHLGTVYMRDLLGLERPRVGLLNVGEEIVKGDDLALASHQLLCQDPALNFVGNIEGHQIIAGACDVLVCDGFVGNVLLKFYESIAGFIAGLLHRTLDAERVGAGLDEVYRVLDYTEYGGAPLLGVNGVSVICHGSSPPKAIKNAIRVASQSVESGMIADMAADLGALAATT